MKKSLLLIFSLPVLILLSGCTIDWHDEKSQKIVELETKIIELETKVKDQSFEKNLKCQALFDGLKRKYSNTYSVYYNEYLNTCYVKYKDIVSKELAEAALEDFGPTK